MLVVCKLMVLQLRFTSKFFITLIASEILDTHVHIPDVILDMSSVGEGLPTQLARRSTLKSGITSKVS